MLLFNFDYLFTCFKMQSLIEKGKKLKIITKKDNAILNPTGNRIIKRLILVALLPHDKVQEGLDYIRQLVNLHFYGDEAWADYLNVYFQNFWINIITPNRFSVNKMKDRTNNFAESYHHELTLVKIKSV